MTNRAAKLTEFISNNDILPIVHLLALIVPTKKLYEIADVQQKVYFTLF